MKIEERPIFLVSPLPASGMADIQRVLCCHPACHIWGEWSYHGESMMALERLIGHRCAYDMDFRDRAEGLRAAMNAGKSLENEWLSEMFPPMDEFYDGIRDLVRATCYTGVPLWGFCTTHTAKHLAPLRFLFRDAFVIVAIRDPIEAIAEWGRYPGEPVLRSLLRRGRAAYADLFDYNKENPDTVLWVDWNDHDCTKGFVDKIYKPLGLERAPRTISAAARRIERDFHDEKMPAPQWAVEHAGRICGAAYRIARTRAERQRPQAIRP